MPRGPKPIMMTIEQAHSWLKAPVKDLERVAKELKPVGLYLRTDNPLYPTKQLKERIKNG